jgi:cell division protein FtsW (lipid II flippase)
LPLSFALLGLIYLIGRQLADREIALWTLATTFAWGDWSLKSIEFRPDVLWSVCWFVVVLILAWQPALGTARGFFVGVLLGIALCTSIKTSFLVPALVLGWIGAWVLCRSERGSSPRKGHTLRWRPGSGF